MLPDGIERENNTKMGYRISLILSACLLEESILSVVVL